MSAKLPASKVKEVVRILAKKQGYKCPLCNGSIHPAANKDPVLDHCHKDGHIRDALCRNCNGMEGKVYNLANRAKAGLTVPEWVENLLKYWERHATSQHGFTHHTHKTEEDKRLARNKKARERRTQLKATQ